MKEMSKKQRNRYVRAMNARHQSSVKRMTKRNKKRQKDARNHWSQEWSE